MKKIIFLFVFLFTACRIFSQTGWQAINLPHNFEQISFLNTNTGWAIVRNVVGIKDTLYKTTNGGLNWFSITYAYSLAQSVDYQVSYSFPSSNTGYITAKFHENDDYEVHKTTNGGLQWIALCLAQQLNPGILFFSPDTGYKTVVTNFPLPQEHLYKTINGGINWYEVAMKKLGILVFPTASTGYHASGSDISKTLNNGNNWTIIKTVSSEYSISSISFVDDLNGWYLFRDTLFKTTNGGFNWNRYSNTLAGKNTCYFVTPSKGWVCGFPGMVMITTNGGTTWNLQNSNTLENLVRIKFFSENTGFIWGGGTAQRVLLKTTTGGSIGINKISEEVPAEYYLFQNHPNPFNPSTYIRFDIPKATSVRVAVYDINGKVVSVLVNTRLLPGSYQADWNASAFSSGVYFYTISAGIYTNSRKMLLIK